MMLVVLNSSWQHTNILNFSVSLKKRQFFSGKKTLDKMGVLVEKKKMLVINSLSLYQMRNLRE